MRTEMFEGKDGWRWRLVGDNGEILSTSEAYASKQGAKDTADLVQAAITSDEALDEELPDRIEDV